MINKNRKKKGRGERQTSKSYLAMVVIFSILFLFSFSLAYIYFTKDSSSSFSISKDTSILEKLQFIYSLIAGQDFISQSVLNNITAETGASNFTHINISTASPYDNLVFYMPFDGDKPNTELTTAYDYSKNNYNGNYINKSYTNSTNCKYGDCLHLNAATTDFIKISDNAGLTLPDGDWALSMWVKLNSNTGSGFQYLFSVGLITGTPFFSWYIPEASYSTSASRNKLAFEAKDDGGITIGYTASTINVGSSTDWQHVSLVRSSGVFTQYINGVANGTITVSNFNAVDASTGLFFGGRSDNNSARSLDGLIDEIMLFNGTLSTDAITAIYNNQSARFMNTGTQDYINQTNYDISTGNNRVNVSTTLDSLLNSKLNLTVGYYDDSWQSTSPQTLTSGVNSTFTITSTSTNLTFNFTHVAGDYSFYSPLMNESFSWEAWTAEEADTTPPQFTTIPANATLIYANESLGVDFTATDNVAISSYFINWTTKFSINSTGYLSNTSILGVSVYEINVSVNDSSGNVNSTIYKVTVNKATPALSISGTTPITYGTITDVSGSNCPAELTCSLNQTNQIFPVGTQVFNYSTAGNTNYTSNWTTKAIVTSQNTSSCSVYFNTTTPQNYPTTFKVMTNCTSGYILYRNGTTILNNSEQTLAVGTWNFTVTRNDTQNYSNIYNTQLFTIGKVNPSGSLASSAGWTLTYPTETVISLSESNTGDGDVTYIVYRNGTSKTTGETVTLGYGTYGYVLNTTGGANYSANASMDAETLTINKNAGSCDVLFNTTSPKSYPYVFKAYSNCSSGFILYRNGTTILNNSEQALAFGTWNFTVTRNDTTNYSNIYDQELFVISEGCIESLVNTSKSDWANITDCQINDTVLQNRSWVQYDENTCGYENVTYFETQEVACNYCSYNLVNTSWGDWSNVSCQSTNLMKEKRNLTQYDSNATTCYAITGLPSDLYTNQTIYEYQTVLDCVYARGTAETCRYKKFGYYNTKLPWFRQMGCI